MNYEGRPDEKAIVIRVKGTPYWLEIDPDVGFGYTPGEDRCPAALRILANEAFLTDDELRALVTCHPACRLGL